MDLLQVLLIEDEPAVARGFTRVLSELSCDVDIAQTMVEARSLLAKAQDGERRYRLVLLDLQLPDGDGSELLGEINRLDPAPYVAVHSAHIDSSRALELAGRCAVALPKPVGTEVLAKLVEKVSSIVLPQSDIAAFCRLRRLSPSESRVLQCRAEGMNNSATAVMLGCQTSTVATHWRRILHKTGFSSQRDVLSAVLQFSLNRSIH